MDNSNDGMFGADQMQSDDSGNKTAQTPEQPITVTVDDLAALEERLDARLQSLTAKQENRLKKDFDARMTTVEQRYREIGMQVPDDVRRRVADEVISAAEAGNRGTGQNQAADLPLSQKVVYDRADAIVQKHGVTLAPGDPEWALVKQTNDPFEFLDSVEAAAKARAERQSLEHTQAAGTPGSRAPMAVQGAAGGDLTEQFKQEVKAARGKGVYAYNQILQKYRERGVDVDNIRVFSG